MMKILRTEIVNGQKVEEHLVDRGNHVSYVTYVSGCEYPGQFDVAVAKLRDGTFPQKRQKPNPISTDLAYSLVFNRGLQLPITTRSEYENQRVGEIADSLHIIRVAEQKLWGELKEIYENR